MSFETKHTGRRQQRQQQWSGAGLMCSTSSQGSGRSILSPSSAKTGCACFLYVFRAAFCCTLVSAEEIAPQFKALFFQSTWLDCSPVVH